MQSNQHNSLVSDAFVTTQLTEGMMSGAESKRSRRLAEVLRKCTNRINEQNRVIQQMMAENAAIKRRAEEAEAQLAELRERNNDSVAVSNAAALALGDAVKELGSVTGQPVAELEDGFRRVRTKHYNDQVSSLLQKGLLSADPRKTGVVAKRRWYVADADGVEPTR